MSIKNKTILIFLLFCKIVPIYAQIPQHIEILEAHTRNFNVSNSLETCRKLIIDANKEKPNLKDVSNKILDIYAFEQKLLSGEFDSVHIKEINNLDTMYVTALNNYISNVNVKWQSEKKKEFDAITKYVNDFVSRCNLFTNDSIIYYKKNIGSALYFLQENGRVLRKEIEADTSGKRKENLLQIAYDLQDRIEKQNDIEKFKGDMLLKQYLDIFIQWKIEFIFGIQCENIQTYHRYFLPIDSLIKTKKAITTMRNLEVVFRCYGDSIDNDFLAVMQKTKNTPLSENCSYNIELESKENVFHLDGFLNQSPTNDDFKSIKEKSQKLVKEYNNLNSKTSTSQFKKQKMNFRINEFVKKNFKRDSSGQLQPKNGKNIDLDSMITKIEESRYYMHYCLCEKYKEEANKYYNANRPPISSKSLTILNNGNYCNEAPKIDLSQSVTIEEAGSIYITEGFVKNPTKSFLILKIKDETFKEVLELYDVGLNIDYITQHKHIIFNRLLFYNDIFIMKEKAKTPRDIGEYILSLKVTLNTKVKDVIKADKLLLPNLKALNLKYDYGQTIENIGFGKSLYNISQIQKK